jgi:hypothetical protein
MKQSVNFTDFIDAFRDHGRGTQFTYEGLRALFGYLEDLEDDIGETELDVIALCCDYQEYENLEALQYEWVDIKDMADLMDTTIVIMIDDTRFIIANY